MSEELLQNIVERLDRVIALLAVQGVSDVNKKIQILKKLGRSSYEIGDLLGIANVRQMEGWKKK